VMIWRANTALPAPTMVTFGIAFGILVARGQANYWQGPAGMPEIVAILRKPAAS
jgi:hypothetical protein